MASIKAVAVWGLLALTAPSIAVAGEVQVAVRDGRVSIVARNATVAEILTEWARVGQMKVENLQVAPRDPMTIQLNDVSEQRAIATVLRRAGGYIATRRDSVDASVSSFERILVMAASAPVARPAAAVPGAAALADPAAQSEADAERAAAYLVAEGQADREAAGLTVVDPPAGAQAGESSPARDRRIPPDPTPVEQAQPDGMVPLFTPVVASPGVDTTPGDPASQEAFRRRRALETVDPSKFNFPQPAAPPKKAGGR